MREGTCGQRAAEQYLCDEGKNKNDGEEKVVLGEPEQNMTPRMQCLTAYPNGPPSCFIVSPPSPSQRPQKWCGCGGGVVVMVVWLFWSSCLPVSPPAVSPLIFPRLFSCLPEHYCSTSPYDGHEGSGSPTSVNIPFEVLWSWSGMLHLEPKSFKGGETERITNITTLLKQVFPLQYWE